MRHAVFLTRGAEERQLLPCSIVVQDHARDADLARIQLRRQSLDILHESHMFSRHDQGISCTCRDPQHRSEEPTSELQSLTRIPYAACSLKTQPRDTTPRQQKRPI